MQWGKEWPVQMNLPFFAVEAYVPGGGPESGRKKFEKMPSGRYRYKNLLFQFFVLKTGPFWQGTKTRFTKNTAFVPPRILTDVPFFSKPLGDAREQFKSRYV